MKLQRPHSCIALLDVRLQPKSLLAAKKGLDNDGLPF